MERSTLPEKRPGSDLDFATTMTRRLGDIAVRPDVWVLTPSLHHEGGTERAVAEQLARWRRDFDLSVYTMELRDADVTGMRVRRIWRPPGPHLVRYVWWLLANRVVRRWDELRLGPPDVLHTPGVNALRADAIGVHIVFAKHWARVRTVLGPHASRPTGMLRVWHRRLYWRLVRYLERPAYGGVAQLWALSREDAAALEALTGRPAGTIPVVPYGVDPSTFSPEARREQRDSARQALELEGLTVLLLVGNDWYKKGLDHAIRALAELPTTHLLAVVGRDDPGPFLQLASELTVETRIRFWPNRSDVMTYYAAADCLLAPSREDAFHLPALEALACGLPVVASREVGATEVMGSPGETIVSVDDVADSRALAAAVLTATAADDEAHMRVESGLAVARARSWDMYANRTADLVRHNLLTPRVLVLAANVYGTGGIERFARSLLRAFSDRYGAERVGLASLWGADVGDAIPAARVLWSGPTRRSGAPARVRWRHQLRFVWGALRLARGWRGRQCVIVCTHVRLAPVALACQLVSGARFVVWSHGMEVWARSRPLERFAMRRAHTLVAGSRFTLAALATQLRIDPDRIQRVPYAVPTEFSRTTDNAPSNMKVLRSGALVLCVARLDRGDAYKGVDTLVLAWPRVLATRPDATLVIVGDGNDRQRLECLTRLLGLAHRIRFTGRLADAALADAYASATVFAMPGRARKGPPPQGEGFGLVFLEAAAAGLPCVGGRAGGTPEAIDDGVTGILVDPESPRDVARGIVSLLENPEQAGRMGEAGRLRATREFSPAAFGERVTALAEALLV